MQMDPTSPSNNRILETENPALLNLACFVCQAADLTAYDGYNVPSEFHHWPYQADLFSNSKDALTLIEATYQWPYWWDDLIDERYQIATQSPTLLIEEKWVLHGLPASLDSYPALRQVVARVWNIFGGWWSHPYIGGKIALERMPSSHQAYNKLQELAPGHWNWDIVFCPVTPIMRYHPPHGWGVVFLDDVWHLEWMTPEIFMPGFEEAR
ncbi:MAG: hypothetical protein OWS74_08050 [Firmicutes bacterium]|nr:hypothetical protein [Bacillota bacterium]